MDKNTFADYLYYNKLPPVYREYDTTLDLYNYLQAVGTGYSNVIEGENNLLKLIDPNQCPEEALPFFCSCLGLKYYKYIPAIYHRRLLSNAGDLLRRIGSYGCIRFLCRVLTKMEINYTYDFVDPLVDPVPADGKKTLIIELKAETLEDASNMDLSSLVVKTFLWDFIPYYITNLIVKNTINTVQLTDTVYRYTMVAQTKIYQLPLNYT